VNALPAPSWDIRAARMRDTASLRARAARLTGHGLRLALDTLIGYQDPVVRRAVLAAVGGAEAGQGPTDEPPAVPTHAVWGRIADGEWEDRGHAGRDACSDFAKRERCGAALSGLAAEFRVLPLGEKPPGAPVAAA
jgi:hypothetical protein